MDLTESRPNVERVQQLLETTLVPLSNARRLAAIESTRFARSGAELLDMAFEALGESKAVPADLKDQIMNAFLSGDWESIENMTGGAARAPCLPPINDAFLAFRRMAITIFYASRKIQQLPLGARRRLGSSILRTNTREELMHLFLTSLQHAVTLDDEARLKIANDVLEGRYYRLLLPDRFDCAELQVRNGERLPPPHTTPSSQSTTLPDDEGIRVSPGGEPIRGSNAPADGGVEVEHVWIDECTQECPICLGYIDTHTVLHCRHVFCRDCIIDWAHQCSDNTAAAPVSGRASPRRHTDVSVACPICRQTDVLPQTRADTRRPSTSSSSGSLGFQFPLPDWSGIFNSRS